MSDFHAAGQVERDAHELFEQLKRICLENPAQLRGADERVLTSVPQVQYILQTGLSDHTRLLEKPDA